MTDLALFAITTLDPEYDGATFVLRGIVRNRKDRKGGEDAARRLPQCEPLRCELHDRT